MRQGKNKCWMIFFVIFCQINRINLVFINNFSCCVLIFINFFLQHLLYLIVTTDLRINKIVYFKGQTY